MNNRYSLLLAFLFLLSTGLPAVLQPSDASSSLLLVVNKEGDSVSYVDLDQMQVSDRVSVGSNPHEIALTPDGQTAVVTNYGNGKGNTLSIIDVSSRKEVRTVSLEPLVGPHGIVITHGGKRAFITCEGSKKVAEVNLNTRELTRTYETRQKLSHMISYHPGQSIIYTANIGSGSVSVIDPERKRDLRIVKTGEGAEGISLSPDGNELWVTNRSEDTISIIDTGTNQVIDTMNCKGIPIRIRHHPERARAFVTCYKSGDLVILNTDERTIMNRVDAGSKPVGIQVMPEQRVFVANTGSNSLMLINIKNGEIIETVSVPDTPDGMALVKR